MATVPLQLTFRLGSQAGGYCVCRAEGGRGSEWQNMSGRQCIRADTCTIHTTIIIVFVGGGVVYTCDLKSTAYFRVHTWYAERTCKSKVILVSFTNSLR